VVEAADLEGALAQPFPCVQDGVFPLRPTPGLGAEPDLPATAGNIMVEQLAQRRPEVIQVGEVGQVREVGVSRIGS
jgi:hypothetical protein